MIEPTATPSIRRRLFTLGAALLACALIGLFFFLRNYAQSAAEQAFDRLLAASALTIAGSVQIEDQGVTVEPPVSALAMLPSSERVFYEARNANGQLITGYPDIAPTLALARSATPVFTYLSYHDEPVRIVTVGRLISASQHAGWVTVRVAETLDARRRLADEILSRSVWPLLLVSLVALALLGFGVRRAFAPLATLERELRQRAPNNLRPLTVPVPQEVGRLVEALNAFMQRLSDIMDTLNTLVADAAHQIRTPLASLRAQAEVALEESDPEQLRKRVTRIHLNATHASQLIHQLLMDATIAHRLEKGTHLPVGVAEIVNEMRRRIGPLATERLSIYIAPEVRRARVEGDRIALREMLRNLVDNALCYAPEGRIEIQVTPIANYRVALTVLDRGPGIANDEKEAVQQRFTRGRAGQAQPGSGLGLAITRSVAAAHGGALWLQDRPGGGLSARIILPLVRHRLTSTLSLWLGAACLCALSGLALPDNTWAADSATRVTHYPAPQASSHVLTIAGPTDTPVITPLVQGFQSARPDITVVYQEMGSRELYEAMLAGQLKTVDALISSATDLQIRLANDGYAQAYTSRYASKLPTWAVWRNEVYGFTFEPAVMVYNPKRYSETTVPRSRQALLQLLERDKQSLKARVATYNIATSSVGYIMAEQDELVSSNFWSLANALGQVGVRLVTTSGEILDAIERDELDIGYNVLGSYALSRQANGARIGVVFPQDYVLVLARSILITRHAPHPELAQALVDWLLSPAGQQVASSHAALGSIMEDTPGRWTSASILQRSHGIVQPVIFGPALLAGLDQRRHARFVQNWLRLVTDTPPTR